MPEGQVLAVILAVGAASYAMRAGGFLMASILPQQGLLPRLLRLAPGNLLAAFTAVGILEGRWPSFVGSIATVVVMAATKREWAALGAGFGASAFVSAVFA